MSLDRSIYPKYAKAPELAQWAGEGEGDGRAYVDPFDPPAAKLRYPSITTVLKLEDKSALVGWAARKVAEKAVERWYDMGRDPEKTISWLQYAHNDERDIRAWVGSGLHAAIDADVRGEYFAHELNPEQEAMYAQWELAKEALGVHPVLSEYTVRVGETMGTADILTDLVDPWTGDSERWLVDVKSSKNIWPGHRMQLAALANGTHRFEKVAEDTPGAALHKYTDSETKRQVKTWWLKQEAPKFDKVGILHIREDKYDLIEVENVELHWQKFQKYRELWELEKQLKKIEG